MNKACEERNKRGTENSEWIREKLRMKQRELCTKNG